MLISSATDDDGLPTASELALHCAVEGFTTTPWPQVNPLLASLVMFADLHPRFADEAAASSRRRAAGSR